MHRLIKLLTTDFFTGIVGDRGIRLYKHPVSARLGMPGLTKLVEQSLAERPRLDEAYAFVMKNQNAVKILTRDKISTNLLELYDDRAEEAKQLFAEMGLTEFQK